MGTLEAIVMILSYVKHNPGARPREIYHELCPNVAEDYGPEIYMQELEHYQNLIFGLEEDGLLFRKEPRSHRFYLGPAISSWGWGFQVNIDSRQISNTHIQYQSVHLPTNTEPGVQTQMLFNRSQARQQLMQLIGALL